MSLMFMSKRNFDPFKNVLLNSFEMYCDVIVRIFQPSVPEPLDYTFMITEMFMNNYQISI